MNKILINSEKEYVDFFKSSFEAIEEIQSLLGVEFPYADGTYHSDWVKGIEINEDQDIDESIYRKFDDSIFPESYPCIMVYLFDNEFDMFGKVKFRLFNFVYLSDFKDRKLILNELTAEAEKLDLGY